MSPGLGLTRDPYLMVSDTNMWVNVGKSQFHLPSGAAQVLRGHTGIVISGREALLERLASVAKKLEGTAFAFSEHNDYVEAICPWGNRVRCYEPDAARFGRITLGIPYVEFDVPVGTAKAHLRASIPRSWGCRPNSRTATAPWRASRSARTSTCNSARPTGAQPEFDGHHVQIYITDFSGPYRKLWERGLVSQEDNQYQYRFRDIVDLAGGRHLFTVEHEVRSATHPMYMRPLVNRNPARDQPHLRARPRAMGLGDGPDEYDRR